MKISPQFRQYALIASIVYISLFILQAIFRTSFIHEPTFIRYSVYFIGQTVYLLVLLYLICLLKYLGERKVITSAFIIYFISSILTFVTEVIVSWRIQRQLTILTGSLMGLSAIFVLITCFIVKDQFFEKSFKVYGSALIITLAFTIGIPIILPLVFHSELYFNVYRYLNFFTLIPFMAMSHIVFLSNRLFRPQNEEEQIASY